MLSDKLAAAWLVLLLCGRPVDVEQGAIREAEAIKSFELVGPDARLLADSC